MMTMTANCYTKNSNFGWKNYCSEMNWKNWIYCLTSWNSIGRNSKNLIGRTNWNYSATMKKMMIYKKNYLNSGSKNLNSGTMN